MFNIENALKIEGWMRPTELQWLAEAAAKSQVIAEVGSWIGRSTRALADNTPGVVYAVDTWLGSDEPKHKALLAGKPMSKDADKPGDNWLFDQFCNNIGVKHLESPHKVRPYQGTSLAGADYLGAHYGFRFDLVFLDASHDYENVKKDIQAWQPLVKPGGVLCGHDFSSSWPGVVRAVRESFDYVKFMRDGSIWHVQL